MYFNFFSIKLYVALICSSVAIINSAHIEGIWNTKDEFFKFLIKFGFRKTDVHKLHPSGFVHGTISSDNHDCDKITLAVLNEEYFLQYYRNRLIEDKDEACSRMFRNFTGTVCDDRCCNGDGHFFTGITGSNGQRNFEQIAYEIHNYEQPRFWYVTFVSCYQDYRVNCSWRYFDLNLKIKYDLWLVNGHPNRSSFDPFVYQFSFEKHDTSEIYLLFFTLYGVLVPIQLYAVCHQRHPITKIFTVGVCLAFLGSFLNLIDSLRYAMNGESLVHLSMIGDILNILSRTIFMLLLLLLAKGWAVTRMELSWHPLVFLIWIIYGIASILLYIWSAKEVDMAMDIDEYQTLPGVLILCFRFLIILWFVLELRNTMKYEHNSRKLNFFLHFGASALVWFIYLPIVAFISLEIHSLWRFKLLLGVVYAADCLAYCVMTHLLWPTRSEQYYLLANSIDNGGDELDVFNEAPHILNNESTDSPIFIHSQYATSINTSRYA